jgi:hypothetical protein
MASNAGCVEDRFDIAREFNPVCRGRGKFGQIDFRRLRLGNYANQKRSLNQGNIKGLEAVTPAAQ